MIARLLSRVAELACADGSAATTGLAPDHPLLRFLAEANPTVAEYLALDDGVIVGALASMDRATDPLIHELAARLRHRTLYKTLDVRVFGHDPGRQRQRMRQLDKMFSEELAEGSVRKDDSAGIGFYTQIGGDDDKTHKKMHILDAGRPNEISELSPMVKALSERQAMTRYYFERDDD